MIRVALVDDHEIFRDGLRHIIGTQPDMEVVGEAVDGETAVAMCEHCRPDVVLMDFSLPLLNGIDATKQIVETRPNIKVLGLSMHANRRLAEELLRNGGVGYIVKDCSSASLLQGVRQAAAGETFIGQKLRTALVVTSEETAWKVQTRLDGLTPRQRQVLQLISEGYDTAEIARKLEISMKTVETYRRQLTARLKVKNVADLTRMAIREGLIPL